MSALDLTPVIDQLNKLIQLAKSDDPEISQEEKDIAIPILEQAITIAQFVQNACDQQSLIFEILPIHKKLCDLISDSNTQQKVRMLSLGLKYGDYNDELKGQLAAKHNELNSLLIQLQGLGIMSGILPPDFEFPDKNPESTEPPQN